MAIAADPRESDARATWYCLPCTLRVKFAAYAGVPDAADRHFADLTAAERKALAEAAGHCPDLGSFAWGLMQL